MTLFYTVYALSFTKLDGWKIAHFLARTGLAASARAVLPVFAELGMELRAAVQISGVDLYVGCR